MKHTITKLHYISGLAQGLRACTEFTKAHVTEVTTIIMNEVTDILTELSAEPEPKPDMHLLFGKEVCETMAEDGIDEACNLINDGAEYAIMKTDGSNLSAILSQLEEYGGYAFISEEEYNKMMEI